MANTFTCLRYHIVFSTKHREPWLQSAFENRVWAYLGGIAKENDVTPLLIGGADDHVHMLLGVPPTIALSEAVKLIKGGSSGWIKQRCPGCRSFGWQDGYSAFTVSQSQIGVVEQYISSQREHHRIKTFQEEYLALLHRHKVKYNPQYLWD